MAGTPKPKKPLPKSLRAIAAVEAGNVDQEHMGNFAHVRAIFALLVAKDGVYRIMAAKGDMTEDEAAVQTEAMLHVLALGFLGKDPDVSGFPEWNRAGGIDLFLRKYWGLSTGLTAFEAVKAGLYRFLCVTRGDWDFTHSAAGKEYLEKAHPSALDASLDVTAQKLIGTGA